MRIERRGFLGKLAALTGGAVAVAHAEPAIQLPRRIIDSRSAATFGSALCGWQPPWPSTEEAIQHAFKYRNRGKASPYWSTSQGEQIFVATYGVLTTRRLIDVVCTDWDDLRTYTTHEPFMSSRGWYDIEDVAKRYPIGYEVGNRRVRGYVMRMKQSCCRACEHLRPDWRCCISWPFTDRSEYAEAAGE